MIGSATIQLQNLQKFTVCWSINQLQNLQNIEFPCQLLIHNLLQNVWLAIRLQSLQNCVLAR